MAALVMNTNFIMESSISNHCPYPSRVQSLISAKLLSECRQRGLESNLASGVLGILVVLHALDYALRATPTILAVCSLRDQETNVGLLNFGDCDRQETDLLSQRVSVLQACFL